jgi:8-oxo-dGTP pyrophosphatase MutT (NUDIX family)
VRFEFPAGTRWALPGGGLEAGEDHVTALRRELAEEVGLHDPEIGPHIWTREHRIAFINGLWDGQREHVHLVRVDDEFEPRPALTWDELASEYMFEIRWWSLDDMRGREDIWWVPRALPDLIRGLVENGAPSSPIDVEP